MPPPKTGLSLFSQVFLWAVGVAVLGALIFWNGRDEFSGEIGGWGFFGLVLMAISGLIAQFSIAGWAAGVAIDERFERPPRE